MTTTKQKADIGAAVAEHELSDLEADALKALVEENVPVDEALARVLEDRDTEHAVEPTEAPAAGESPEPTRDQLQALDAETKRHDEAVRVIMGSFVDGFASCETCGGVGIVPPDAGPPTHEYFHECPTCNGWTVVKTGAKDPQHATRPCPGCKGRGYLEAMVDGRPLAGDQGTTVAAPPAPPAPAGDGAPAVAATNGEPQVEFGTPAWMGDPGIGA